MLSIILLMKKAESKIFGKIIKKGQGATGMIPYTKGHIYETDL